MQRGEIDKLRRLGLTEQTSSGAEGVRVSAQHQGPVSGEAMKERRKCLESWAESLGGKLALRGAEVVINSLSVTGQTVEAIVPVDELESVTSDLSSEGVRVDIVMPRQVIPK